MMLYFRQETLGLLVNKFIIIFTDCIDGFYNNSCNIKCGKCKAKAVCDKNNGSCPDGCDGSFHSPLCKGNSQYFITSFKTLSTLFTIFIKTSFICQFDNGT